MARSTTLLCCALLGLLHPLEAFLCSAVLPVRSHARSLVPFSVCTLCCGASNVELERRGRADGDQDCSIASPGDARRSPRRVDEVRRYFVTSSLVAGSLLAVSFPSFAEGGSDDEDEQGGAPAWAVDIEVPAYADSKAWMWKDLRDGNIVKAETKLAAADIFYPQWMNGLWKVESTTRFVEAPLGEELFGRGGALQEARKDIGQPLSYQARFRTAPGGKVIADRAFNVNSISRAAMGETAVLECFLEDGNADRLKMTLVPSGAGGRVFDALLYVTSRDQTRVSETVQDFGCSETSHQTVVAQNDAIKGNVGSGGVSIPRKATTSVKDIQVIQVFQRENAKDPTPTSFTSVQRISTFMTEDEFRERLRSKKFQGPGTAQKFSDIKKTPIDVRVYDISYTLLRRARGSKSATSSVLAAAEDSEPTDSDSEE